MKLAIMQPYFLPYIGYFQLIAAVDVFILHDRIKYTKKGWINRNRFLLNGKDAVFSLPLRKGSDSLDIADRELANDFNRQRLLAQFSGAYARAPYFLPTMSLLERIVNFRETNLFGFLHHSIIETCRHLEIDTEIRVSSNLPVDEGLKAQDKVIALCRAAGADTYLNSTGGMALYAKEDFRRSGIDLKFIKPNPIDYPQFGQEFVPWLSIVDVLMFNSVRTIADRFINDHVLLD